MIKKILKLFKKEKPEKRNKHFDEIDLINQFDFSKFCKQCFFKNDCEKSCELWKQNFDKNKKTCIIIDDNRGIISIVKNALKELHYENKINLNKWNILTFEGGHAAIFFLKFLLQNNFKNINCALIDITFGNILRINNKNIKINGIHLAYFLKKLYPNIKFYFYTGNTLNEYVKYQKELKDFFKEFYGESIDKYVLNKINTSDEDLKLALLNLMKGS